MKSVFHHYSVFLLLCFLIQATAGASVSVHPDSIETGESLTISIGGLDDGSTFSILTEGRFPATTGEELSFQLNDYTIPFSLSSGKIIAHTENTRWVSFKAKKGNTTAGLESEPENGIFTYTKEQDISAGTYDFFVFDSVPLSKNLPVLTQMQVTGTKNGPSDSTITFIPDGIESGTIQIIVLVDGTGALNQLIQIGSVARLVQNTSPDNTYSSPDGRAELSGEEIEYLRFIKVEGSDISDDWELIGDVYSILPEGLELSSPAALTFIIPGDIAENIDNYTLFIAEYNTETWNMLPSRIESRGAKAVIQTEITHTATFALMTLAPEPTPLPATTPEPKISLSLFCPALAVLIVLLISLYTRHCNNRRFT
jgi:membrane-associated protease RseP (regulator of RpoE activity)